MLIIVFIFGTLVGSFLNVCIYRIPLNQEIVYTPSHCMNCGVGIKWYELIPVISWLALKGQCRYCKTKLSPQYPIIELINGLAYTFMVYSFGLTTTTVVFAILFSSLLVISMIDVKYMIIPNGIVIFLFVMGIINTVFFTHSYIDSLIGFFAVSTILLIINIVTGGQMGMGDVKLMAVCGIIIGWKGILLSLFIGSIFGSIIGLILIAIKVNGKKQEIPFGPYLSLGIMIAALYGNELIEMYLNLIY